MPLITNYADIKLADNIDMVIDNGEPAIEYDDQQNTNNILKVIFNLRPGESSAWPNAGLDLDEIIGKKNTEETGKKIIALIENTIHRDTPFLASEFKIDVFPVSKEAVMVELTKISNESGEQTYNLLFELTSGKIIGI